jgi:hypothetical protein
MGVEEGGGECQARRVTVKASARQRWQRGSQQGVGSTSINQGENLKHTQVRGYEKTKKYLNASKTSLFTGPSIDESGRFKYRFC